MQRGMDLNSFNLVKYCLCSQQFLKTVNMNKMAGYPVSAHTGYLFGRITGYLASE